MSKNKSNRTRFLIWILFIFCLGFLLRFVNLETIPPGLYVDEAAIGYNAYSILKTGKDEWGKPFPLLFRSFGVYAMPVYIYSSVIPIAIWGLRPFSVRFISALSGSLTIIFIFLLVREMFDQKTKLLPLIAALIFAISPWSIFFSRGAFESNLALFFFVLGIYLLVKGFKNNPYLLIFSLAIFALSTYTYQTERLMILLFFFLFSCLFLKDIIEKWNKIRFPLAAGFLVFFLLEIPQLLLLPYPTSQIRFTGLRVLPDTPFFSFKVGVEVLSQYAAYFSPRNLFFEPDPDPQRSLPGLSVFYSWMVIPYLIGLWYLFLNFRKFGEKLTVLLLAISPAAASFTRDPFSTLRSQPLLLPLTIVIALGIYQITLFVKNRIIIISGALLVLLFSLISLYRSNFVLLPNERFLIWKYGFNELAANLAKYKNEKILIDDPKGNAYIELLFFLKYDPKDYQKTISPQIISEYYRNIDYDRTSSFGNIQIRTIIWKKDIYENQMIVGGPIAISEDQAREHFLAKIFTVNDPEGKAIFNGFRTNPELKIEDDLRKLKERKLK